MTESISPGATGVGGFQVPKAKHRVEETIARSRFITTVARAQTVDAAHEFLATIREEFPDATHHCWAFIAGPPGSSSSVGMSDDGEPHGTAGRPMLHTLTHSSVGEIVAVCARYYGGTKLGTGGLARAYSGGVALALETLPTTTMVDRVPVVVVVPYTAVDSFERLQERFDFRIQNRSYDTDAHYQCEVPSQCLSEFEHAVNELTRGAATISGPQNR